MSNPRSRDDAPTSVTGYRPSSGGEFSQSDFHHPVTRRGAVRMVTAARVSAEKS